MDERKFIEMLEDLMDTADDLDMDTRLEDVEEWDSLSHIAFMAFCSTRGHSDIKPADIKAARTVGDLYNMARDDS